MYVLVSERCALEEEEDLSDVPCRLTTSSLEVEEIKTNKIKNYENNELFKKLFDKIK